MQFCFKDLIFYIIFICFIFSGVETYCDESFDYCQVKFFLFTRNNPNKPIEIITDNRSTLDTSTFNKNIPTKIIIHGYYSNIQRDVFTLIKDAYIETGNYNVIGMDWSKLSNRDYISALWGLISASKALANFLNWMQINKYLQIDQVHLIGHSLGSHLAGITGDRVTLIGKIKRITGLDPASVGFKDVPADLRLDKNDAILVDVIHTSSSALAIDRPLGHIDFYPNGGVIQPGCPKFFNIRVSVTCNHARAYWYFAESIRNRFGFATFRCDNYKQAIYKNCTEKSDVFMGNAKTYKSGIYYLRTRSRTPFSNN